MNLFQEYKELYYKELETRNYLEGKLGTTLTLMTALSSLHMVIWKAIIADDFFKERAVVLGVMVLILEMMSIFSTLLAMYYFFKSYYKYQYKYISISDMKKKVDENNELIQHYTQAEIDEANEETLCATFCECAIFNRKENIRKSKNQENLGACMMVSLILSVLTVGTMYVCQVKIL